MTSGPIYQEKQLIYLEPEVTSGVLMGVLVIVILGDLWIPFLSEKTIITLT